MFVLSFVLPLSFSCLHMSYLNTLRILFWCIYGIFKCISLYSSSGGCSVYYIICTSAQSTDFDILLVWVKCRNLTSLSIPGIIIILSIFSTYTENKVRQCYNFCFNHQPQFRKLKRKRNIYLICHIFTLSIVLPLRYSLVYSFIFSV